MRYHELLPHEIRDQRALCPVGFVGVGTIEWHSEHAAVGLDGLKAERLCELAAAASGGFAFPTLWYGEPRSVKHMDSDRHEGQAIRRSLGLPAHPAFPRVHPRTEIRRFQALVQQVVLQLYWSGMQVVYLVGGHYPLNGWMRTVAERVNTDVSTARTLVGSELDFAAIDRLRGVVGADHAGVWETSLLWHLRPECVDLSVYEGRDGEPLVGVIGQDPRRGASRELGARACECIVAGLVANARAALRALPDADTDDPR